VIGELIGLAEAKELGLASYIHLIRSPTQETLECQLSLRLPTSTLVLKTKSVEELNEHYEMLWDIEFLGGKRGYECVQSSLLVLDERGMKDKTVIFASW